jgi:hypothetical protein
MQTSLTSILSDVSVHVPAIWDLQVYTQTRCLVSPKNKRLIYKTPFYNPPAMCAPLG